MGIFFTASPNQSVGNWLDGILGFFGTKVFNESQTSARIELNDQAPQKTDLSDKQISVPMTADSIRKTVAESVNKSLKKMLSDLRVADPEKTDPENYKIASRVPNESLETTRVMSKNSSDTKVEKNQEIAQGFEELYPETVSKNNTKIEQNITQSKTNDKDEAPQYRDPTNARNFMNPNERHQALSELIQSLQLTYLESSGN